MGREVERCETALRMAQTGAAVAVVSSGDPGVYGMAGVMLEVAEKNQSDIPIEIIPGLSAANLAAAALGAPLMHDFAVISLSDLLTPWEKISQRLDLCAQADMIICLYNPKSIGRTEQIVQAWKIISSHKKPNTPAGVVKNAGRPEQEVYITELCQLLDLDKRIGIDMFSLVVIGNNSTFNTNKKMITPRGYQI